MRRNRKILVICVCMLVTLMSFPSLLATEETETLSYPVTTSQYVGGSILKTTTTDLTTEDINELKTLLTQLDLALNNNDEKQIETLTSLIQEKGVPLKVPNYLERSIYNSRNTYPTTATTDIDNTMCYFHAVGQGSLLFTLGVLTMQWIDNQVGNFSNFMEILILIIIFAPIWAPIYIIQHLIPFRILMPIGQLRMDEGTIRTWGAEGAKSVDVALGNSVDLNLSFFSGVTINIPLNIEENETDGILFVSGFAGKALQTN